LQNLKSLAVILSISLFLASCDSSVPSEPNPTIEVEELVIESKTEQPIGTPIPVFSDGASYKMISSQRMDNGNLEVITFRDGPSGTSYARREVDCASMTFRYLGEGDTLPEAEVDGSNLGRMSEAMSTSISGEVSRFACSQ
jgi:hypothetical protein